MILCLAVLLLLATSLALAHVAGPAAVIDGDMLDVADERTHL